MQIADDFDALQKAADYCSVRKSLKGAGIAGMVFGGLTLLEGALALKSDPIGIVLILIGGMLAAEGVWVKLAPRPVTFILSGVNFFILAA